MFCLNALIECYLELCDNFRTEEILHHSWMTYQIASDLLDVVLDKYTIRNGLCIRTFYVFITALAHFDFLIDKRGSGEKINTQHKNTTAPLVIFHKQRDAIIHWLKKQPILSETRRYFKVLFRRININSAEQTFIH